MPQMRELPTGPQRERLLLLARGCILVPNRRQTSFSLVSRTHTPTAPILAHCARLFIARGWVSFRKPPGAYLLTPLGLRVLQADARMLKALQEKNRCPARAQPPQPQPQKEFQGDFSRSHPRR